MNWFLSGNSGDGSDVAEKKRDSRIGPTSELLARQPSWRGCVLIRAVAGSAGGSATTPCRAQARLLQAAARSAASSSSPEPQAATLIVASATFIDVLHRHKLNATFGLPLRRAPRTPCPLHSQGARSADVEAVFRRHASLLRPSAQPWQGQHRSGWQDTARQLRQLPRSGRGPGAQRFRHPPSCSPMSISPRNPTRSRRRRHCSAELGVGNGAIVTLDALHCKKTFRGRRRSRDHPDRPGKGNQPTLHQKIEEISVRPLGSAHSHDKGRNRDETRTVTVFDPGDKFAGTDWHPHVAASSASSAMCSPETARPGCYDTPPRPPSISQTSRLPLPGPPRRFARTGRSRPPPITRDATFAEDRSRIRTEPRHFRPAAQFGSTSSRQIGTTR